MPRSFFDQVIITEKRRPARSWIKGVSLILHIVALFVLMVLPITAAFDLPGVYTRLPTVMLASVPSAPPEPPPPAAMSPTPTLASAVPLEAPEGVTPEPESPPRTTSVGVPGGLPASGGGLPSGGIPGEQRVTLSQPPPTAPEPPRRVGGVIRQPERTHFVAPDYPAVAKAARVGGLVILEAVIDATGVVRDVRVLKSVPLLDRAAIEAVKQWRYTPTELNGVAIPVVMTVTVSFDLR